MASDLLTKEASGLPEKYIEMAVSYIRFLQSEFQKSKGKENPETGVIFRHPGGLKEKFELPDDFDEVPECFKGYI